MFDPSSPTYALQLMGFTCVVVVLFLILAFYGMYRTAKKGRQQVAKAVPAEARVLKIGHSSASRAYGDVLVHLKFEVMPANGAPYELDTEWSMEPASVTKLQEGKILKIKIDPGDPKKIYSAESWIRALGQEPTDE